MKKVLIMSHNVLSPTSSMGKTLISYFHDCETSDLAQFYIHSEVPTDTLCQNYYRVTDKDMIKSIFTRKSGTVLGAQDICTDRTSSRTDTGMTGNIYQKARRRTPFIYFARNLLWSLGRWNTKKLNRWVDEFAPDAIFFACGDYAFMYKIVRKIAERRNIPVYICCMDDYYFYNKNQNRFGGKWLHKRFMKQVKKTMSASKHLFAICDKMTKDYGEYFNIPASTLHTASSFSGPLPVEKKTNHISYIGNLGYQRADQLVALGQALKRLNVPGKPEAIDVYSAEKRPEVLQKLSEENGIHFCGEINAARVKEVMAESMLLIHTESFNEITRKQVAYSVSTKIADSLASGTCLLAYGPAEVASIQYLIDNHAAKCMTDEAELESGLTEIILNEGLREEIIQNALAMAARNHDGTKVCREVMAKIEQV